MNRQKRVFSIIFICFVILISNLAGLVNISELNGNIVYAKQYLNGFEASKKDVQYIYKFFMDKGLSSAAACGIIGNIAAENTKFELTADNGSTYGLFQWKQGRYTNIKARKEHDTLKGQLQFAWEEMVNDCKSYFDDTSFSGTTWKKFKKCKDPVEASKVFMVCFERCSPEGYPHGYQYCNSVYYEGYDNRVKYAKMAFKKLDGTEIEDVAEKTENSTAEVLGVEKAEYISEKYSKHSLNGYAVDDVEMSGLTAEERVMVGQIQNRLDLEDSFGDTITKNVRIAFMLFGILIVVYALVLFLAFWFDSYNPFFEMSFLRLVSFGKYYAQTEIGEQGVDGVKALSLKGVLVILAMGTFFSVFILSGKAFMFIDFIFTKLQMLG